jgi:hypothetical protein
MPLRGAWPWIGLAQFLVRKETCCGNVNQIRRGEFDREEVELPGEELLLEIRNSIKVEAARTDEKFGTAESNGELISELVDSRRNCCAESAVRKESARAQESAQVAASGQGLWACAD